jgi:hypothetical protein
MTRSGVFLSIFVLLSSICFSTASRAEGFFEMLFGGGRQHVESHATYVLAPQLVHHHALPRHRVAAHHKKAPHYAARTHSHHHALARRLGGPSAVQLGYAAMPASLGGPAAERKCCSNAQDAIAKLLRDDPTLRPGDAYMSPDGLRVYDGDREKDQKFVPVGQARALDRNSKARLAAVEMAPVKYILRNPDLKPQSVVNSAAHAALAPEQKPTKLNKERFIRTLSGKTIRFVGGYAG